MTTIDDGTTSAEPVETKSRMIRVRVDDENYRYLQQAFSIAGISMSQAVTDLLLMAATSIRSIFGDDLAKIDGTRRGQYLRQLVRLAMVNMVQALDEADEAIEHQPKKKSRRKAL